MFKTMDLTDVAPCSLKDRHLRFPRYPEGKGLTVSPRYVNPKSGSLVSTECSQCNWKNKSAAPRKIKRRKKLTGQYDPRREDLETS
jgi:hypothetical protein